jgi:hypothetical protein
MFTLFNVVRQGGSMRQSVIHATLGMGMLVGFGACGTPAMALTLKDVQAVLAARPNASWTAMDKGTWERLEIGSRSNPFGLIEEEVEARRIRAQGASGSRVPARIDWRDRDGVNWMSPIKDQGKCGSCVAFAAVGAFEGMLNIASNKPDLNVNLSEEYLFANIGSCGMGSMGQMSAYSLKNEGTVDEACHPYVAGRTGQNPDNEKACDDASKRKLKLRSFEFRDDDEAIKEALQEGPVQTRMTVYEDFMFYSSGVYEYATGDALGGHAVTLVGYDDAERYWIVRNSWGEAWGENGYFRIRYNDKSGVGETGTQFLVDDPAITHRIASPAHLEAVSKKFRLKVRAMDARVKTRLVWTLVDHEYGRGYATGVLPAGALTAEIDVSKLDDGHYELQVVPESRPTLGRMDAIMIVVANEEPALTLTLDPDFTTTGPINGRVYFTLNTKGSGAPLTHAVFHVESEDGSYSKQTRVEDPGDRVKIGWRTTVGPEGKYRVWVEGHVGAFYQMETEKLEYEVAQ